jgi:CheY-like chemotaxis protein
MFYSKSTNSLLPSDRVLRPESLRVLLVDHYPDSLNLGIAVLESYHFNIMPATSAEQALQHGPQFRPNVVITELCLPEKDGYFLVNKLRAWAADSDPAIPAIALTTQASDRDRQQTSVAGFQRHIAKPYSIDELLSAIADLVNAVPEDRC